MKLYRISVAGNAEIKPVFVGSQADCAKVRKDLNSGQGIKRADINTEEVDVPTGKAGLIEFLNGL